MKINAEEANRVMEILQEQRNNLATEYAILRAKYEVLLDAIEIDTGKDNRNEQRDSGESSEQ